MSETPIELTNIPEDLAITDVFEHVPPLEVANNPDLRRRLIEFYREEREKFVDEGKRGKKVKPKKKVDQGELLNEKI